MIIERSVSIFTTVRVLALWIFAAIFFHPSLGHAEQQTTLSVTEPNLDPGQQGSFTASTVSGPAGSVTANLVNPYAGILQYQLNAGTGRFASLSGTRYGVGFDSFRLFQSFLTNNFFTMVSSSTSCPAATNYTYLFIRMRSPDAPRFPTDVSVAGTTVGGALTYNPAGSPVFSSSSRFDLAGPTAFGTGYSFSNAAFSACASGVERTTAAGSVIPDTYAKFFYGSSFAFMYTAGGNPLVALLVPQQTLTAPIMANLGKHNFSGLFTAYSSNSSQTQNAIYATPDTAGTTYTLKTVTSFTDPTQNTTYGTLTCTTLNSPATGFCRGTLTLNGVSGSGNAVCQVGSTATQDVLSCAFQYPSDNRIAGSIVVTRSPKAVISVTLPSTAPNIAAGNSTSITATIQNLTGSQITGLSNSAVPAELLSSPFTNPTYSGSGGICGSTLNGFASCTLSIPFNPSAVGTSMQTFRVAYNNQVTTVNGTSALVAAAGLSSLAISPNSSSFATGGTQQFVATATYSNGSTQDVTSAVTWGSSASGIASMATTGLATFAGTGSVTISAALAGVSTNFTPTVYNAPPNPSAFSVTGTNYTQLDLGWTTGGGSTTAFQLAYQTGATAPADCNAGTVISSGVVGAATSYSVTGLTPGTQYAFRVCAVGATAGSLSTGVTTTGTTTIPHTIFATSGTYRGNLGSIYFADFICQTEAASAGLTGIWRAVIGDETVSTGTHISLSQSIYNTRPSGSGGIQLVSTSANFFTNAHTNNINYNAAGGAVGSANVWTGTNFNGTIFAGRTCTSWTTSSSGVNGEYGVSTGTNGTWSTSNQATCNNLQSLYCINLQSAAAAPADPTGFSTYSLGPTSISFLFSSGGTTTAGYKLAYQTGGTAPANCNSGTVVSASTIGINPTTYNLTGLTASTQYSFRLCAVNSDQSAASSGVTLTATTLAAGSTVTVDLSTRQIIFSTATAYNGAFGGLYYADFICQNEAATAGLSGVWKAILSDESTTALSRISIAGKIYNNRPYSSGGLQEIAGNAATFWASSIAYASNYTAAGATPGSVNTWSGSTAAGAIQTGVTCSSWTTSGSGTNGRYGTSSGTGNIISNNTSACNGTLSLYCTNQQSASAAPADPTGFATYTLGPTAISFIWTSGGGTTAGYKLAYQTGGTAPANCNSGTVIGATTLGLNPSAYTVSSLTASTQYSFRLCAVNSDQSSVSTGVTVTATTLASGSTVTYDLSSRQVVFSTTGTTSGNIGGIYFADYICQKEANDAGLSGIWKAIISDEATSATSRISFPGKVYNFRSLASGGIQEVAPNSAAFWSSAATAAVNYSASGGSPGAATTWTGSTAAGAIQAGVTCTSWTTGSSGTNGRTGTNTATPTFVSNNNTTCNTQSSLLCTNQQSSSAAPADPGSFATYTLGPTSISFTWVSGGGTTAGYKLAYQTGGTAPANCSSGTVISSSSLGYNPTSYTVSSLTASTQYSFRLCAVNSDESSVSTGVTLTTSTLSAGSAVTTDLTNRQVVFATASGFTGNIGGLYFADFICQSEAGTAGLSGIWKAILSDEATSATSRITVAGKVYNNRPLSSGGIQEIASDSSAFWGSSVAYTVNYNAGGSAPNSTISWTGSTAAGAIVPSNTCTSWTTASSGVNGQYGTNTNTGNVINTNTTACNTSRTLYCTNQQSSSAAPSNPTGFSTYTLGPTSISFIWTSGGGTTAAYKLAYQTGGTAPANCSSGTVVSAATLGYNPTSYTLNGLTASTQYSFRLCAVNSDQSSESSGATVTASTLSSGSAVTVDLSSRQVVFATTTTYYGNFGGIYFADYICQKEASDASLTGIWKAILSDESTTALSRISIAGKVYNNRPLASGGLQEIAANSSSFWSSAAAYAVNYTAGGSTPGSTVTWTGSTAAGASQSGNTCTNWTVSSSGVNGRYANSNTTGNIMSVNNTACNTSRSLYCTNQQSAAAAPSNPTSFTAVETGSTYVGFTWANGGGTTAAYKIVYQTGGTAPANCSSGTAIAPSSIGINPTSYVVTGLTASTQYSFRLCAMNSDLSSASSGTTLTVTTLASGASATVDYSSTQILFNTAGRYTGAFGGIYFADYICQQEAVSAGLGGIWKALISDDSNSASTRLSITGPVYNHRPGSSGGIQRIATNSTAFWLAQFEYALNYTASGSNPTNGNTWTGSNFDGTLKSGQNCTGWTSASGGVTGGYGFSSNVFATSVFNNGNPACNNTMSFYCINRQTSSAAPSNPSGFAQSAVGTTSVSFTWTNGGGTTAGYKLAYQTGGTAPANCSSGTVIPSSTLGIAPVSYTVTGLTAGTQYSFRLCAVNSDESSVSSGTTVTSTTTSLTTPANQTIFSTGTAYYPNFGGIYFADYICQQEATAAALAGIWKAILSDSSTAANARITLAATVWNNRPSGSGGAQQIATSGAYFAGAGTYTATQNYNAAGGAPAQTNTWSGSTTVGASYAGRTCSDWTTLGSGTNGQYGNNNTTTMVNALSANQLACNNARSIYCIDQQTSAATPSDPSGFAALYTTTSAVGLVWTNGGGTTAGYRIAYQSGGTAPANCSSGTVIGTGTLGINPSTYTVTGLSAGTQYSFRLCAVNSDDSAASSGVTVTATTRSAGQPISYSVGSKQFIFVTSNTYRGSFGGLYFGDYICQSEAEGAGLTGIWKAVLSDSGTSASSRISLSGDVYNLRDPSSGGSEKITDATNFWNAIFNNDINYTAAGSAAAVAQVWTGSSSAGAINANTCTDWTSQLSSVNGQYGTATSTTQGISTGTRACNNLTSLYCINQQTSSAAPSNPTGFTNYVTSATSIGFSWASGGGTTAAYQMSYQTGGTAPANCTTGTVILPSTIGVNPTTYTVSGLTASTQYSFRLCAINSDKSSLSSGVTATVTTTASGTVYSLGTTQAVFGTVGVYTGRFGGVYFADFACQKEADAAGLTGIWKAILSDSTTAASSRISLSSAIYNTRDGSQGGMQQISDSTNFWIGPWSNVANYSASGTSPGATRGWTGTGTTGLADSTNYCADWGSASASAVGRYGTFATATNPVTSGTANCTPNYSFYCINQQSASAAPPDPSAFSAISTGNTFVTLAWDTGGGTTAAYKIAYQTGGTAPANCASGTVIGASTIGVYPSQYTITGLTASTQYSFRLCATNSDQSSVSSGLTTTVTTSAAGTSFNLGTTHLLFSTSATYTGLLGSVYFGDFICQNEAEAAGLSGIWRALLSDESVPMSTHVSLSGYMYNLRPGSSGGMQEIMEDTGFYGNSTLKNTFNYTASGAGPGSTIGWTGSTSAGAINAGLTCSNWSTSSATANGTYGTNNVTLNYVNTGNTNCGSSRTLFCVNQQASSAAPSDPASFGYLSLGTSFITLNWTSGGGTTAGYKLAYQTGGTAPANCASGTVISAATLGNNPSVYTLTGLSSSTQYSFRLCAVNSDQSSVSTGLTQTITTSAAGTQFNMGSNYFMFSTATTYYGNFGGIYFADFACQNEADSAGLAGLWKAVISDETTTAASRITTGTNIYNLRPAGSGGIQEVIPGSLLFSSPTIKGLVNYTATGAAPGSTFGWTGSTIAGLSSAGNTCTNWTVGATTSNGALGRNNATTANVFVQNTTCGTLRGFLCINQQSASAAPSDPTGFNALATGSTFVTLNWASGGGTTAAYKIAYQSGGTAPANCSTGTVISAATLGVNPTQYTISSLSASTQYSFRICAVNSDQSSASTGVTLTVTTTGSGTTFNMGSNQFIFPTTANYYGHFGGNYFADYICQNEASSAGHAGIWKAIISDGTTAASSRISVSGKIYNLRPGGSGGIQRIADSSNLFNTGGLLATFPYSATGAAPGGVFGWTGSTAAGAVSGTNQCSNWTTSSPSGVGALNRNDVLTSPVFNTTTNCGTARTLVCINQQSASAVPPDPINFLSDFVASSYIGFTWASGGGTTAAYQISYQSGGTAPANCSAGTVVSYATLGLNPTSYAISGLSPSTQYSFRICALNSDFSLMSSGTTLTVTTSASGLTFSPGTNQYMFTTSATYNGNIGGLYFADFICQNEALAAGLTGTWKAILGDDTTSISTRIAKSTYLYNTRAASSGGSQRIGSDTYLLDGILLGTGNYTASGTTATATRTWTGSGASGALNATQVCTNWTSASAAVTARYGTVNTILNTWLNSGGNAACNNLYALNCINQQTAPATPTNPATFTQGTTTATTVQFNWTNGGGTTAGYRIAYQLGATAPNNCVTGTTVSASTIGINPTTYTVTGLSSGTQYSFRLCSVNSDYSAESAGSTITLTMP